MFHFLLNWPLFWGHLVHFRGCNKLPPWVVPLTQPTQPLAHFSTTAGDGARKFGEFPCRDGQISTGLDTSEGVSDGGDVVFYLPGEATSLGSWKDSGTQKEAGSSGKPSISRGFCCLFQGRVAVFGGTDMPPCSYSRAKRLKSLGILWSTKRHEIWHVLFVSLPKMCCNL